MDRVMFTLPMPGNNRIQVFDPSGNYVTQWGGLFSPRSLAINKNNGNVYVADYGNDRVVKFDPLGAYITEWGANYPLGIAVNSTGYVYVTESNDYRTRLFDANGNYILQWGSRGSERGQFKFPTAITTGPSGNVYVVDGDNGRIEVFTPSGSYITQWGTYGIGPDELSSPEGIAIDESENAYVAEYSSYRVHVFSKGFGNFARFYAQPQGGTAPLTVQFTDFSSFTPTAWNWDFGDGDSTNATDPNPVHTYLNTGTYSVTLTVSDAYGSNSSTRNNYIFLNPAYVEQFSIDKKLLLKGDSFNITIKGQAYQKYYLYFDNLSVPSGGYPLIVAGQPGVNATPAAEAEIELYQPYSAIGIPGTKSIITIPESGIMNVTFTTTAATIDRTFWIDLTSPGSSGYMMGQVYLTIRDALPPVPGPGETRITFNDAEQTGSSISGNRIVWSDTRNGNSDIFLYDISTHTESQITFDTSWQYGPAISGDQIVWVDDRRGYADIYLYNISTHTERRITSDTSWHYQPAISGDLIAWSDYRNGNYDIYLYDLLTDTESQITTDSADQYWPAIYGDLIAWSDYRNANSAIYLYNISTQTESQMTISSGGQYEPAIYGDRIVWTDYRNGNYDIYSYNLTTHSETPVTTNSANQYSPAIYSDRIVWEDYRNGNPDIYFYNLTTLAEQSMCIDNADQYLARISENNIVWTDLRGGSPDIYLYTISSPNSVVNNTIINQYATIFIGEEGLDISHALNQAQGLPFDGIPPVTTIGYWVSAADRETTSASKTIPITSASPYKVTLEEFGIGGSIADWYIVNVLVLEKIWYSVSPIPHLISESGMSNMQLMSQEHR